MGQQQLLLIVLGVIIVGVAVVLGIQYFSVGAEEGAKDELVAHCLTIGANAQQWYKKPVAMGGGGGAFDATYQLNGGWDVPAKMSYTTSAGNSTTAGYAATVGAQQVVIIGTPNSPEYDWTVECTVNPEDMVTEIVGNP